MHHPLSFLGALAMQSGPGPGLMEAYVAGEVGAFVAEYAPLHDLVGEANEARSGWARYSEAWRSWSSVDASIAGAGYTRAEHAWSVLGERDACARSGRVVERVARFVESSGGRVELMVVTDARGGAVVHTDPSSELEPDFFQGDEAPFIEAMERGEPVVDSSDGAWRAVVPMRDAAGEVIGSVLVVLGEEAFASGG